MFKIVFIHRTSFNFSLYSVSSNSETFLCHLEILKRGFFTFEADICRCSSFIQWYTFLLLPGPFPGHIDRLFPRSPTYRLPQHWEAILDIWPEKIIRSTLQPCLRLNILRFLVFVQDSPFCPLFHFQGRRSPLQYTGYGGLCGHSGGIGGRLPFQDQVSLVLNEESSSWLPGYGMPSFGPCCTTTTHFLMCFSNVLGTENGISQKRHLYVSFPCLPCVFMCLVSFELCAHAYEHNSHL